MTTHVFKIVLDREPSSVELDRLHEAGLDDALIGAERGVWTAEFDREAPTMAEAIASAVQQIDSTGLVASRVVDEDVLTLADIADRIGQSRESVRRYATAERGPGGFPPPVNPGREGTTFYRWSDVVPWFQRHLKLEIEAEDPALAMANLILQARRFQSRVDNAGVLTKLLAAD